MLCPRLRSAASVGLGHNMPAGRSSAEQPEQLVIVRSWYPQWSTVGQVVDPILHAGALEHFLWQRQIQHGFK